MGNIQVQPRNDCEADCACQLVATCQFCDSSIAPYEFRVVVSGIVNNGCSDCTSLNGTYYLQFLGVFLLPPFNTVTCVWECPLSSPVCGVAEAIQIQKIGNGFFDTRIVIVDRLGDPEGAFAYMVSNLGLAANSDCLGYSSVTGSFSNSAVPGDCTGTGGTGAVTAV